LEALELFGTYTAEGALFVQWYRTWVTALVGHPHWDRADLEVWLSFGYWLQPGLDLIGLLEQRLQKEQQSKDPIVELMKGYQIAIFTLDERSARRTRDILLDRNPTLRIDLCHDKVNSERAQALAKSANMVVIVTQCISHALFYAIEPHVSAPVYPTSRGSSSILRKIEEIAAQRST
jgi:hypothetical protein